MRKQYYLLTSIFVSLLLLVACNTAEQPTKEPASDFTSADNSKDNEQTTNGKTPTEENTQTEKDKNRITYTTNGKTVTEETTIITSNSQSYTINTLPQFTLKAEEPGNDMLVYSEDDTVSMRIEKHSINDIVFEELVNNTEEMVSAIGNSEQFNLEQYIGEDNRITNYSAYKVDFENEVVIAIVFQKEDQLVRLTIFDNKLVDMSEAMIKMGLSIQ